MNALLLSKLLIYLICGKNHETKSEKLCCVVKVLKQFTSALSQHRGSCWSSCTWTLLRTAVLHSNYTVGTGGDSTHSRQCLWFHQMYNSRFQRCPEKKRKDWYMCIFFFLKAMSTSWWRKKQCRGYKKTLSQMKRYRSVARWNPGVRSNLDPVWRLPLTALICNTK